MFNKLKKKIRIKRIIKRITILEQKRSRSQAGLVDAILSNTTPDDADVDFFNYYTDRINHLRAILKQENSEM